MIDLGTTAVGTICFYRAPFRFGTNSPPFGMRSLLLGLLRSLASNREHRYWNTEVRLRIGGTTRGEDNLLAFSKAYE